MNEQQQTAVSEEEIHAYVDGSLAAHRREEIDRLLERNEDLAARISDYFAINNMFHDRYDRVLAEPVPKRLVDAAGGRRAQAANSASFWPRLAGMAATLVLGVAIGAAATNGGALSSMMPGGGNSFMRTARFDENMAFVRQSAMAHVVYAPEVMRPVEVGVDREHELVKWVSSRLGTDVHPPVLTRNGFELMGGRILPGSDGPIAQFMYRDAQGERVTLCISHRKVNSNTTAFKLYQDGLVNVFYWVDGDFGYAVSGGIDRKMLLDLSHDVYAQLTAGTGGATATGAASPAQPASGTIAD